MSRAAVMLVEDEQIIALDIQQCLEELGYLVVGSTDNGSEAITLARNHRPDIVLMDIMLKGDMDGTAAGRAISALGIPVVYLTAYSDARTVQRAAESAPYGFLTKPYDRNELSATLEVALCKARIERQQRAAERWLSNSLRCMSDGVLVVDTSLRLQFLNAVAEQLTGWPLAEARGQPAAAVLHLEGAQVLTEELQGALTGNEIGIAVHDALLTARDRRISRVEYSVAPLREEDGAITGLAIVLRDTEERQSPFVRLQESEAHFRQIFQSSGVGMAVVGLDGQLQQVNPAFAALLGYEPDTLADQPQALICHQLGDGREQRELVDLLNGRSTEAEVEKCFVHGQDGRLMWMQAVVTLLRESGKPPCYLYQLQDMSLRHEQAARVQQLAQLDHLTGLFNRLYLDQELIRAVSRARRYQEALTVVFLDLDDFKRVNDELGHAAGDKLLKAVATRLRAAVRETDRVCRFGGDEFVLILRHLDSAETVSQLMAKLMLAVDKPVAIGPQDIQVRASAGISRLHADADSPEQLLEHADQALLAAKAAGRHRFLFFGQAA